MTGLAVVGIQHLLETTGSLVESIIGLGVRAEDIYLGGKLYSTCEPVAARLRSIGVHVQDPPAVPHWGGFSAQLDAMAEMLWHRFLASGRNGLRGVVVLDDGGFALKAAGRVGRLPLARIAGVEQTTSGINSLSECPPAFPVVDVATSAAKTLLESPLIERAVLRRIGQLDLGNGHRRVWGIAGMGNIGKALAAALLARGEAVCAFDPGLSAEFPSGVAKCLSLKDLFEQADIVLGCSGEDLLLGSTWWQECPGEKVLASCSSHDVEFRTILSAFGRGQKAQLTDPLSTVTVPTKRGRLRLLRGGCPVNFDGSGESVPAGEIQLTRGLLLGGVLQAAEQLKGAHPGGYRRWMLSAELQSFVAREWRKAQAAAGAPDPGFVDLFGDEGRIIASSGGQGPTVAPLGRWIPDAQFPPARSE
ncbi:MAG: NAD(P)-dependent oxidoreductase [Paludibaculum sp.]